MAGRKRTNISQSPRQWGGLFFDEVGPAASDLATLCRDPKTTRLLHDRGVAFVEAIEASGMEPPDTPLLEWGDLTIDESLERDAVAEMLEQAIDDGQLAPEAPGWRQRQAELVEGYLLAADKSETTPLARIYAARRQAWLELSGDGEERALLEATTPQVEAIPTLADAEAAIEPLLWLLGRLADGVKLTQTGALPRAVIRDAIERYPDWWDSDLFGPPPREADVYQLDVLHALVDELKLARPRRGILKLGPRGRSLRADPSALLSTIASTIATTGGSAQLDLALADLLRGDEHDLDFRLLHLLGPFFGIIGGRFRREAEATSGGRTFAAAILRARACGPRHSFG